MTEATLKIEHVGTDLGRLEFIIQAAARRHALDDFTAMCRKSAHDPLTRCTVRPVLLGPAE